MQYPKCTTEMEDLEIYEVIVKHCGVCGGLLFDRSRHEYLKDMQDAGDIDTGDADIGKAFNKKDRVFLPGMFSTDDKDGCRRSTSHMV